MILHQDPPNLKLKPGKLLKKLTELMLPMESCLSLNLMTEFCLVKLPVPITTFRQYYGVAKTLSKMLGPLPEKREDYMQVGRAYINAERYQAADSIFQIIIKSSPDYVPAYLWIARTYSKMDPDTKLGLARSKFEKVAEVAKVDSVKNES